jgi:hypothetical protein
VTRQDGIDTTQLPVELPVASPRFGHGLDPVENGRKGGVRSGEVRREQSKSVRERLRERVEEEFELVWAALRDGLEAVGDAGDPDARTRILAAQAVLAEAYGRPPQALIGDPDAPIKFVLESAFRRPDPALEEGES